MIEVGFMLFVIIDGVFADKVICLPVFNHQTNLHSHNFINLSTDSISKGLFLWAKLLIFERLS